MGSKTRRTYSGAGDAKVVLSVAQRRALTQAIRSYRADPDGGRPWREVKAELEARLYGDATRPLVPVPVEVRVGPMVIMTEPESLQARLRDERIYTPTPVEVEV